MKRTGAVKDPAPRSKQKMLERAGPILARLPAGRPIMVEVGVSVGTLAEHLLHTRLDMTWHGVDPWRGRQDQPVAYVATGDAHAALPLHTAERHMAEALERVRTFAERATVWREASPEAAHHFADRTLDLAFLDGDHSRRRP